MEANRFDITEIEETAAGTDGAIRELADLELALVGGGHGDVVI